MQTIWTDIDKYFANVLGLSDPVLDAALAANDKAGLPMIDVSSALGRFLDLVVRIAGARRVLEIGTLGGYSTIILARAVGGGGRVVTLELEARHAEVARANLKAAGMLERVDVRVAPALETLAVLAEAGAAPFDLIFIDADKAGIPDYLAASLKLARPGTIIVIDNVVRNGKVIEANSSDADIQGVRRGMEMIAADPRLSATAIQTVGIKGYDGFALVRVG